ncbi:UDP-N-acetyl glucosamine 2-epimerase [Devosia sp. Root436]|jgi:UDP-N-acetylglucosamine 2-epimerase (non-hydrolysing)|uniref:non-hydrolyzing UDP-N-acetylglucosamine 2-epimerase n=1 Tax=Devosia sp. Root436 TaxID=1736537 RepID=UPI0006F32AC8|nr:UDP-N-acetylglucosamine 2-epimerase (non-hydrolyzing) [Devosia sp. Root436]KQX35651.1 UDP-N-acetyl glucosamine 2-epimerase [Devosia sp. Root436]
MPKIKVMTIVGTRPEIIRLSRVIEKLDRYTDHCLVHTGQNYDYELNEIFFEELGIRRPDVFLNAAGDTAAATIGQVIMGADVALAEHKPDALLLLGDTNSCLAAISAKRRKVAIFHMEAGNRCFDFRVPEEINRKIVDHISDINLTYSSIARDYLLAEGFPADQVIKTGSPMREVLAHYRPAIDRSDVLERLGLRERNYFVVSAHREETVDRPDSLRKLHGILSSLADQHGLPIVVSTHPRTRQRLDALNLGDAPNVYFHKPFGFLDYVRLQMGARAVLSDSGTITEESSILNFPALNLREVHERPEGFEEASVMLVGLDLDRISQALRVLDDQARGDRRELRMVADYEPENVSDKIVRIILSYTGFVKRRVWHQAD